MEKQILPSKYPTGGLYLFEEWDFASGRGPQQKFSIILHQNAATCLVLHCWPTKVDRSPALLRAKPGCISASPYSCYKFKAGKKVTTNGWSFNLDTYVYAGSGLDMNSYDVLEVHARHGKLKFVGLLLAPEQDALIQCMLRSEDIKLRYKRFLAADAA
jgi:hypothetical protein